MSTEKINKRRLSILKRTCSEDSPAKATTKFNRRRISFSEKTTVKEFALDLDNHNTIWLSSYEKPADQQSSKSSSNQQANDLNTTILGSKDIETTIYNNNDSFMNPTNILIDQQTSNNSQFMEFSTNNKENISSLALNTTLNQTVTKCMGLDLTKNIPTQQQESNSLTIGYDISSTATDQTLSKSASNSMELEFTQIEHRKEDINPLAYGDDILITPDQTSKIITKSVEMEYTKHKEMVNNLFSSGDSNANYREMDTDDSVTFKNKNSSDISGFSSLLDNLELSDNTPEFLEKSNRYLTNVDNSSNKTCINEIHMETTTCPIDNIENVSNLSNISNISIDTQKELSLLPNYNVEINKTNLIDANCSITKSIPINNIEYFNKQIVDEEKIEKQVEKTELQNNKKCEKLFYGIFKPPENFIIEQQIVDEKNQVERIDLPINKKSEELFYEILESPENFITEQPIVDEENIEKNGEKTDLQSNFKKSEEIYPYEILEPPENFIKKEDHKEYVSMSEIRRLSGQFTIKPKDEQKPESIIENTNIDVDKSMNSSLINSQTFNESLINTQSFDESRRFLNSIVQMNELVNLTVTRNNEDENDVIKTKKNANKTIESLNAYTNRLTLAQFDDQSLLQRDQTEFQLDFSGLERLIGTASINDVIQAHEIRRQRLKIEEDNLISENVEAPDILFLVKNKIEEITSTPNPKPPIQLKSIFPLGLSFQFLWDNKFRTEKETSKWIYDDRFFCAGFAIFRHKKVRSLFIHFSFVNENICEHVNQNGKLLFQKVIMKPCPITTKKMLPRYLLCHREILSKLHCDLTSLCPTSNEIDVFLQKIDEIFCSAYYKAIELYRIAYENEGMLSEEEGEIFAERAIINMEKMSIQRITIKLVLIDNIGPKNVYTSPTLEFDIEKLNELPMGMEFFKAILCDPYKYVKDKKLK